MAGVLGTQQKVYTFDAPVISMIALTNAAVTDGTRVTVSGSDFGAVSYTPTARVGKTRCATTSWLSATTLSCVVAAGTGNTLMAAVDMFGVIGTYTGVFTYDSPVLSHALNHNGPTSGGAELTMQVKKKSGVGSNPVSLWGRHDGWFCLYRVIGTAGWVRLGC